MTVIMVRIATSGMTTRPARPNTSLRRLVGDERLGGADLPGGESGQREAGDDRHEREAEDEQQDQRAR